MDCSRGSEWRRWDLHIHTPDTLKNDNYTVTSGEEKWQKYFDTILEYVNDMSDPQKAVFAVGITDYYSVENYKKVVSNTDINSKIPLLLPNVELRLTPVSSETPLNLHCIFNPMLTPEEIEDRFLGQLSFQRNGTSYSATPSSLIRLGKAIENGTQNNDLHYKRIAVSQYVVDINQIRELFNNDSDLRNNTLIVVPNGSLDGASGIGNISTVNANSSLKTLREELYKFSDAIFSSKENDINYFLGKGVDSPEKVKQTCGKLMPCIHASDAHQYDKIFEPAQKRYCWIKADCTFNGLKQITYEPETRVRISEFKPEEKKPYYVIDQVIISDENFTNQPILFNENLTCIIGGKSTGKSVLLNNIAITIDNKQVEDKYAIINADKIRSSFYPSPKMIVKWRDGTESLRSDVSNDRKIVYIPQTYLNRLADETTEKTDIDEIIEDVLLQNTVIKSAFDQMNKKITDNKSYIDKKIYDITTNRNKAKEIKNKILELGVLKSIEDEIKKLKLKKQELSKQASLSEDELKECDKAINGNRTIDAKLLALTTYKEFLKDNDSLLVKTEIDPFLDDEYIKLIETEMQKEYELAQKVWNDYKVEQGKFISAQEKELQAQKVKNKAVIDSAQKKMVDTEAANKLNKDIEIEEKKKIDIENHYKQLEALEKQYKADIDDLNAKSRSFENIYDAFALIVNNETGLANTDESGLKFNACSVFRGDFFEEEFKKAFDRGKRKFKDIMRFEENACQYNDYDDKCRQEIVEASFIDGSMSILKKATTIESALRVIFSDFFTVNYTVSIENDTIKEMSPGKKALVLLKLLISLAESNCPILIDQPEDDLDNRSIYKELASFIREKKSTRQIILVTHNANIVLGCDAEEVIIANQSGINSPNNQFRFEYRSGSIENVEPKKDRNGAVYSGILNLKGIQQQICEILEGGKDAFNTRKKKYSFSE